MVAGLPASCAAERRGALVPGGLDLFGLGGDPQLLATSVRPRCRTASWFDGEGVTGVEVELEDDHRDGNHDRVHPPNLGTEHATEKRAVCPSSEG